MIAQAVRAQYARDDGEDDPEAMEFDIMDIIDAMIFHYQTTHTEVMSWSWKLFCAKWCRVIAAMAKQREREHEQHVQNEYQKLWDAAGG